MNKNPTETDLGGKTAMARGILRWAVKQTFFFLVVVAALLLPAGERAGVRDWIYLGMIGGIQLLTALALIPFRPDLLLERSRLKEGFKIWDVFLAVIIAYSPAFIALAAGLEIRLRAASPTPDFTMTAAVAAVLAGSLFTLWAMLANRFFSGVVRIQTDRGHTVADGGPYRLVRHPGYAGMLVFLAASPAVLGSGWAAAVAVAAVVVTFVRTWLEDRTLQAELPGYAEYAQRVRYRLIPGIW